MKIVHVITSLKIGGAESALLNFLRQDLQDKNNEHYVIYFYSGPNLEKIKNLGIKTFCFSCHPGQGPGILTLIFAYLKLKKIIKNINPDIIHSSLWLANFYSKFVARSLKIPVICDLHSNFLHDGKLRKYLEYINVLWADKYIAVSNNVKTGFLKTFKIFKSKLEPKITVINNGININNIKNIINNNLNNLSKKDLGFSDSDFIVGAVGRLEQIKLYNILIEAVSICNKTNNNKIKLCLVGSGSQEQELKNLSIKLGQDKNILFAGITDNPYKYYQLFSCFVISSKSEGLSISLLEAMAFGLPIVSTVYGNAHDVLTDQVNSILVESGDSCSLANAISKIYLDKLLAERIGSACAALVLEKYSIVTVKDSYHKIFKQTYLEREKIV